MGIENQIFQYGHHEYCGMRPLNSAVDNSVEEETPIYLSIDSISLLREFVLTHYWIAHKVVL
jgi:hypothetical protein